MSYRPVVALDLDGVLRIPAGEPGREIRTGVMVADVTMRRASFPSYSHDEPPWDDVGEWTAPHTFSGTGAAWVRDLEARDIDLVWISSWGAYVNVYFAPALGLPPLPFMDGVVGLDEPNRSLSSARWLGQQFAGRPLLWVSGAVTPETLAELRARRSPTDRARTRALLPDRYLGITSTDASTMDAWLDAAQSEQGQDELRRRDRRRTATRRSVAVTDRWGSSTRYRRWRAARERLTPSLGSESVLLTLLADYVLERGDEIDSEYVAQLRAEWGRPTDPPVDALVGLLRLPRRRTRTNVLAWRGSGYPPGLGGLLSRGHANGLRTLDVGRGWWPLLMALDDDLARIDLEYTVSRVRSSEGHLLLAVQSSRPEWFAPAFAQVTRAAQRRAARTCERCGRRGSRREVEGAPASVLCDVHARPLTEDEVTFALAAGVPPDVFVLNGEIEGALSEVHRLSNNM